jgi:hypothetical protein
VRRLAIGKWRLPIGALRARCGFARRSHDGREVVRFLQQGGQLAGGLDARFGKQLKPQRRFIRFLFNSSDFGDEFSFASSAAGCPVIRGHRSAAADDLFGDDTPGVIGFWNCPRQLDNPKRKVFRALLQFLGVHAPKLPSQSPIANRQLAILL